MKKRILVVDYEPKSLDLLLKMIPAETYDIQTAKDGMAAVEEFDAFHPDLVLLRTMLPKKHGFQVCQEIVGKGGSKPVPVVMHCSIYKGKKYQTDAIKIYGASEYLDAPVASEVLQGILERYLGGGASPSAASSLPEAPVLPVAPAIPAAPAAPSPRPASPKQSLNIDRALEETLSGLNVMGAPKRRVEAPKPVAAEAPKVVTPPLPPPPPPPEAEAPKPQADPGLTSEELFGEVIQSVSPAKPAPVAPPVVEAPKPKPVEVVIPAPAPPRSTPAVPVDLSKDLLQPMGGDGDAAAKKVASAKARQELDRKLEETLSGFRPPTKSSPPAPAAPKVELPAIEMPKMEAPKVTLPKVELPEISIPKAEAPKPAPLKVEVPEIALPKAVAPKAEAAPPPPAPPKEEPKAEAPKPPAVEEAPKEKGIPFGQYLLMDKIAVGGMAELFKAKQRGLEGFQRIVAIKRILPHLAANDEFVTMFIDEAKLAAQLKHPNIVHIYDLGKLEESYFIAMELVEGMDLRSLLRTLEEKGSTLPPKAVLFIAHQIAAALQYAHTARDADGRKMHLVHRDVSPQNILLSGTGEVKLVDFGIAKAASKASHTQSGALKGKLLYMSPEQAYGQVTDARTDIFSLAAVMFEMFTGAKLFSGDSEMSILEKVREAKLPDFAACGDKIPEGLQRVLRRALEKDLNRRYNDCKAFQVDLEKFARQEWKAVPGPYQAVSFLSEFFPEVYKKETVQFLAHDEPKPEESVAVEEKTEAPAPPAPPVAAKPELAPEPKPVKSQRGKPVPGAKKYMPPKPTPQESRPAESKPEPAKVEEKPKADPPKPKAVPPPPKPDSTFSSEEESEPKSKKGLFIGLGAAVGVIALVAVFALKGSGKPAETAKPEPAAAIPAPAEPAANPEPQPAPPPVLAVPEPAQPAPGAAPATEAELRTSRDKASKAVKAFDAAIVAAEGAGAGTYAAESLASLKKNKGVIDGAFRSAKLVQDFDSVASLAQQAVSLANTVKDQALAASKAAEEKAGAEAAAAAEARRLAEETERKKAAEAAAAAATPQGVKPGDFVEVFQLNVKPKETQPIKVEYTLMARKNRLQGQFYLEVSVDETGAVTAAKVVKGPTPDYGMGDALVQAARAMRYSPGIKDGVPVKTKVTFPVRCEVK